MDENKVTFKTLLQRLMVELVKDEAEKDNARIEAATTAANEVRDAAKAERERKKAEALERSRQRQANPEYFAQKGVANTEGVAMKAKKLEEAANVPVETTEEEPADESAISDDPFRSYASKSKNKIFVK